MDNTKFTKGRWLSDITSWRNSKPTVIKIQSDKENAFSGKSIASIGISNNDNDLDRFYYTEDEAMANALLISKSLQMLEMLEELISDNTRENTWKAKKEKARQLIKEATDINKN